MQLSELKLGFDQEHYQDRGEQYCALYLCKPTPQTEAMIWEVVSRLWAIAVRYSATPRPRPWHSTPMMTASPDEPLTLKCLLLHIASLTAEQQQQELLSNYHYRP